MNYDSLLAKAETDFDSFSLVWRDEFDFNENAAAIERELAPFQIEEVRTDEWPGTKIFHALATVRHYRVSPASIKILKCVTNFGSWMAPNYPEDLAFYKDDEVVYASIAHENMGSLHLCRRR